MVHILLKYGTDINAVDRFGRTSFFYAVLFRRFHTEKLLLEKGKANLQTIICAGRTPSSVTNDFHFREFILLLSGANGLDAHYMER